jgi:hypothetical protein
LQQRLEDANASPRSRPRRARAWNLEPNSGANAPPTDASQNKTNDQRAVARSAIPTLSPGATPTRTINTIASATPNDAAIHSVVVRLRIADHLVECINAQANQYRTPLF